MYYNVEYLFQKKVVINWYIHFFNTNENFIPKKIKSRVNCEMLVKYTGMVLQIKFDFTKKLQELNSRISRRYSVSAWCLETDQTVVTLTLCFLRQMFEVPS